MNSSDSIKVIFAAIGVALLWFWEKVTDWARQSFFPFVEKHLPEILEYVEKAFTWIDNVVVSIRRGIKAAWNKVRQYLLKMAMHFEKTSSSKWVRKTTSYIIKTLESKTVTKQEVEEEINWDDLPLDVRKSWMKSKENNFDIDYTAEKDKNVDSLEMIN
ncbi:hypothetical protein I8752_29625 [Nostocaceae cyanobacterium CENA369]|uniref:Uncharacterized protein n=1 Tax=Dendronalium phyllosphericum CENA369 TaxID=1725256 RepID=A0A8J7LIV8_9NOST|nr:hypothetical protein [Dendronalium phyllosphericum]MBH8577069.1 hypothetical protein [Dendronalium phyllosphericum CENA369]